MRIRTLALLIAVMGVSAGALAGAGPAAASENPTRGRATINVSITEFMFSPSRLQAHVGDTVKWTNNGTVSHTSSAKGQVWDSGTLTPGASFSFTFSSTGLFRYRCQIHPTLMKGSIQVSP